MNGDIVSFSTLYIPVTNSNPSEVSFKIPPTNRVTFLLGVSGVLLCA